ncbi:hypothetical protein [Billgrantia endophytica]|uniref:Uncharacterized protein n=1 Tax=Billgrantia endophytica TaxID=2033802 RepID=A0A2N7TXB2_9GAMM|nr:hypothetical protein [Halomonas endophytica]PMR72828.1 hypothetical protein C1H69_19470 [Halomonas endophytica]
MKHTIRWGMATLVAMLLPGSLALLRWWAACLFFLVVAGLSMLTYGLANGWPGMAFLTLLIVMGALLGLYGLAVSVALLIVVEHARCDSPSSSPTSPLHAQANSYATTVGAIDHRENVNI